eukprot:TRINITY_DN2508_c0_g1_i2.p1 TRINITY_DN2508_c0_g1~~TRINITY_DN2508_c0_g1_i2.p1  ORF type:complete len:392 (-),score=-24.15 TRINITY_DN2508_c0_g1_i2:528-1655(-)
MQTHHIMPFIPKQIRKFIPKYRYRLVGIITIMSLVDSFSSFLGLPESNPLLIFVLTTRRGGSIYVRGLWLNTSFIHLKGHQRPQNAALLFCNLWSFPHLLCSWNWYLVPNITQIIATAFAGLCNLIIAYILLKSVNRRMAGWSVLIYTVLVTTIIHLCGLWGKQGNISAQIFIIQTLHLSFLGFDYTDGFSKASSKTALMTLPTFLEYLAAGFCPSQCLSGPSGHISDFLHYIYQCEEYTKPVNSTPAAAKNLIASLAWLAVSIKVTSFFPVNKLLDPKFSSISLDRRVILAYFIFLDHLLFACNFRGESRVLCYLRSLKCCSYHLWTILQRIPQNYGKTSIRQTLHGKLTSYRAERVFRRRCRPLERAGPNVDR